MGAGEANAEGDGSLQALAAKSARLTVPVALQAYMKRSLFIFSEGTHFHRYSRDDSRRHRSANKFKQLRTLPDSSVLCLCGCFYMNRRANGRAEVTVDD